VGAFNEPSDIVVDYQGRIWVVDTGNSRLVCFDEDFNLIKIIDHVIYKGEEQPLNVPESMFINEKGELFIADTGNERVLRLNEETLVVDHSFEKPKTEMYEQTDSFIPVKIIVDSSDILYVLCRSVNKGFVTFNRQGTFLAYFGTVNITVTAEVISQAFWQQFMSEQQLDSIANFSPIEYKTIDIDNEGFFYATVIPEKDYGENQLRKLNAKGTNILVQRRRNLLERTHTAIYFGDRHLRRIKGVVQKNQFIDVTVNDDCTAFFLLDQTHGKVFAYDEVCNLLYVFGGKGDQKGLFKEPCAVEMLNNKIYVLDKSDGSVTTFKPTTFGGLVHTAANLYNLGEFQQAIEPWKEVLKYNSNYELAFVGLGDAELENGNFKEAMEYFKLSQDPKGYEDAFKEYRDIVLKENFEYILYAVVLLLALYVALKIVKARKKAKGGKGK
jgi:tetratricopeptide (TPR) repeat protein